MADYTIRIESDSNRAHKDLDSIDKKLKNLQAPIKVNIQFPSFSETVKGIQDVGKALQTTYGIARNVVPALMDIESIGAALGQTFQTTAKAAILLSQASPGKTLAVSLQGAVLASDTLISSVARLGFTIFGITQSVNVLKSAYGGMFDETIGREVRLQQVMLQTQTTIAATNKILRNGVELTNPLDSVMALKRPIQKAIDDIRVESLEIAGTTSEAIIQVFGTVSSQIGQVGGSIEDAKKLALSFSAALGTIGMSDPGLATQEVGSMLRGDIDNNSILARSLGITNKDILKAKQTGDLVDFITKKLAAFTAGQKIQAQGFAGITSNIQEIQQEMGRALGAPMLQPLLDGLSEAYRRMSLIVKPAMQIADGMGRAGAAIGGGLVGGTMAAPSLQKFTDSSQKDAFNGINKATAELFLRVQTEIDKLRPTIAKFTDEMVKAFVMVGSGLKELFEGFVNFKFEQLKILVNTFANMASVLNATVIPAVSTLLTLYGKLIEQPMFQYISQLTAQFAVLEKIGVNGLIRISMTMPSVINSIMGLKRGFDFVVSAIQAGLAKIGTWLAGAIAGVSQAIGFSGAKVLEIGVLIVQTVLRIGQIIAGTISGVLVQIATFFARVFPQFPELELIILQVANSFSMIGRKAAVAATDVEIQAIRMALALDKLKISSAQVGAAAQQGVTNVGNKIKDAGAAVGGFLGTQILSFVKFIGWMVLAQVAVTVLVDAFGRFQRKNDEIAAQTRTELAIKRLSTTYKDLGDNASYAAKKGKEMEESIVNNRYDELTKNIAESSKALNELKYEMNAPGIQSFSELMRVAFVDPRDAIEVLREEFEKLKTSIIGLWQSVGGALGEPLKRAFAAPLAVVYLLKVAVEGLGKALPYLVPIVNAIGNAFKSVAVIIADLVSKTGGWLAMLKNTPFGYLLNLRNRADAKGDQRDAKETAEELQKAKDEQARIGRQKDQEAQEDAIKILGQKKIDISKELRAQERAHENAMFQLRQQSLQKAAEIISLEADLRIKAADRLNARLLEGQEGVRRSVTQGINEYLSAKMKGEQTIENTRRSLQIELNSMEKSILDYRYETEKTIAAIRLKVGDYEKQVSEYKVKQAALEQKARDQGGDPSNPITAPGVGSGFRVGSTGNSSGPHLDIRGPNKQKVIEEALAIILSLQKSGVGYMELPNSGQNILNIKDPNKLRSLLSAEQGAHDSTRRRRPSASGNAIDISLPAGTLIPVPVSAPSWTTGGGWTAKSQLTGNTLMHGLATSQASGATMGPTAVQGRPVGTVAPIGGKPHTWDGQNWIGEGGKVGKGTPPSAPTAPVMPDLKALFDSQTGVQASATRNLEAQMQRIVDLKNQLVGADTAEKFDNIIKNALPTVGIKEYEDGVANANIALEEMKKNVGKAYDPEQLSLTISNQQKLNGLTDARKEALAAIAEKRNAQGGVLSLQQQADLAQKVNNWFNQQATNMGRVVKLSEEALRIKKEMALVSKLDNDLKDIELNTARESISIATNLNAMRMRPDDFVGQRLNKAAGDTANYRLQLRKENPDLPVEKLEEAVTKFGEAAKAAAIQLGTLEKAAKKQADAWAKGSELAKEFSGGFRNIFKAFMSGGDLGEAAGSFTQSLTDKVMGQFMDMAFKPMEENMTKMFAKLFGADVSDPTKDNTIATRENTAAFTALTAQLGAGAANNIVSGPGAFGNNPFGPSSFSPEAAFGTASMGLESSLSGVNALATESSTALAGLTQNFKELNPVAVQAASGMQTVLGGMTTLATGAATIFGGLSQMGKGGTFNVLSGLAGVFGGIGGLLGGGLFGGFRASGGPVLPTRSYIVGENGPELFSPTGSGSILPADTTSGLFSETRAALAPMGGPSAPSPSGPPGGDITMKFESTSINGVEYVTAEQFQKGMQSAATRGRDMAYSGMQGDPRVRRALGLG